MVATVEVEGIRRDISLMLLPEANEGYVCLLPGKYYFCNTVVSSDRKTAEMDRTG